MSTPEPNPLELSEAETEPVVRRRVGKGPRSADFGQLMLQLCLMGGVIALVGALLSISLWKQHEPIEILYVPLPILVVGLLLISAGRGLGSYKAWAWYVAVAALVPMNLVVAAYCLWLSYQAGIIAYFTLFAPAYCGFVLWTLLSAAGRENYWRSVAAVERAKNDPSRVRRRYRSR